jgi:hypothetical protein
VLALIRNFGEIECRDAIHFLRLCRDTGPPSRRVLCFWVLVSSHEMRPADIAGTINESRTAVKTPLIFLIRQGIIRSMPRLEKDVIGYVSSPITRCFVMGHSAEMFCESELVDKPVPELVNRLARQWRG